MTARQRVGGAARQWLMTATEQAQLSLLRMSEAERERLWDMMTAAVLAHAADLRQRCAHECTVNDCWHRCHTDDMAAVLCVLLDPSEEEES